MSEALDALQKTVAEACALIDRLQAENKKLREGLTKIEDETSDPLARRVSRKALRGEDKE